MMVAWEALIPHLLRLAARGLRMYPAGEVIGILEEVVKGLEKLKGESPPTPPPEEEKKRETSERSEGGSSSGGSGHEGIVGEVGEVKEEREEAEQKVDPERARIYTNKQAIKHIIAVEDHLRADDEELCKACLSERHLPALEMYVQEGRSFCKDECDAYSDLRELIRKTEQQMQGDFSLREREKLAEEFRRVRKRLLGYERTAKELAEEFGDRTASIAQMENE